MRVFLQEYTCHDCGKRFTVRQSAPGVDEDIAFCWECIDILLPPRKESSSEDLLFLLSGLA